MLPPLVLPVLLGVKTLAINETALRNLLHEVRLLFDQDAAVQSQGYELVKIAEVLRAAQGQGAVLSRRYIPPSLSVHAPPVPSSTITSKSRRGTPACSMRYCLSSTMLLCIYPAGHGG